MVEQRTFNPLVQGSSPWGGTTGLVRPDPVFVPDAPGVWEPSAPAMVVLPGGSVTP